MARFPALHDTLLTRAHMRRGWLRGSTRNLLCPRPLIVFFLTPYGRQMASFGPPSPFTMFLGTAKGPSSVACPSLASVEALDSPRPFMASTLHTPSPSVPIPMQPSHYASLPMERSYSLPAATQQEHDIRLSMQCGMGSSSSSRAWCTYTPPEYATSYLLSESPVLHEELSGSASSPGASVRRHQSWALLSRAALVHSHRACATPPPSSTDALL